jgi:hypothetical protein
MRIHLAIVALVGSTLLACGGGGVEDRTEKVDGECTDVGEVASAEQAGEKGTRPLYTDDGITLSAYTDDGVTLAARPPCKRRESQTSPAPSPTGH